MPIIDFHNHVYPTAYIEAVEAGPSAYTITYDADNNPVFHSPGDYNVLVPGHRNMDFRKEVLDKVSVDMQVISFTAPWKEPAQNYSQLIANIPLSGNV